MAHDSGGGDVGGQLLDALRWAYDRTIDGIAHVSGAEALADEYLKSAMDQETAIDSLVRWTIAQAGGAGFVAGLGGLITLPVAVPANFVSVTALQLRMVAAIAHIRGYDVRSEKVRTLALACLCGTGVTDALKDAGISVASKMAGNAINSLSGATLTKINQAVGFRLVTKAGTSGTVNLSKFIPLVGGVVSGGLDAATTYGIGSAARAIFTPLDPTTTEAPDVPTASGLETPTATSS